MGNKELDADDTWRAELRRRITHPYITRQYLQPPSEGEKEALDREDGEGRQPCDPED